MKVQEMENVAQEIENVVQEYAVYLKATSNAMLKERMDNGEIIEGMLQVNFRLGEISFTFGERLAFRFSECSAGTNGEFYFSDGTSYFAFSPERPEVVKEMK